MINWFTRAASSVAIICALICLGLNTAYAKPSLKDYGLLPEIELIAVSPSGDLVAFRKRTVASDRIMVISLSSHKQVTSIDVASIKPRNMYFLNDDQLILVAYKSTHPLGFLEKFDISTAFLVDFKGGAIRQLLKPGEFPVYVGQTGLGSVVGISPDGNYAYMPAYTFEDLGSDLDASKIEKKNYSLLQVDLKKDKRPKILSKGTSNTNDFFVDDQGNVVAEESYDNSTNIHKVRARQNGEWVDVFKEKKEIREKSFVGVTPDYKSLVMLNTNEKTGRRDYYTMSLSNGAISEAIFGRDDADIAGIVDNFQRVIYGVQYAGFRPSYQFFNPQLNQRMKDIANAFPEQSVYLSSYSFDWKNIVVYVEGSTAASEYYLFSEGKEPQFLTSSRPSIKPEDINPIATVTFVARDGLKIPTLLTIPSDKVNAMKNLPAVIMPHGGPESHDTIGFDWMAQAFASNGYLVIQPQFRGSNGFGLKHIQAGYGEWGKKMQDDITDAVNFAIKKGIVDPTKICIVGWSYGGYAALAGGAFTPELYKCVVSIAGLGDIKSMLNSDKEKGGKDSELVAYMRRQFTNSEDDSKSMAAASPQNFASNFKAPVLLIHGTEDKRVPVKQSRKMNDELKDAKKDVTYIEIKDEDHSLLINGESRLQTLEEMIKFVNAHLGQATLKVAVPQ